MVKSVILLLGFIAVLGSGLHIQMNHQAFRSRVTIQADNGLYLARCNNCGQGGKYPDSAAVYAKSPTDPLAIWKVEDTGNGYVLLRADNGFYLVVCENCWPGSELSQAVFVQNTNGPNKLNAFWSIIDLRNGKKIIQPYAWDGCLMRAENQVANSKYPNFAFASASDIESPAAQWTIRAA